jgi:hypothetical protein
MAPGGADEAGWGHGPMRHLRAFTVVCLLLPAVTGPGEEPAREPRVPDADFERLRRALDLRAQPWARIPWRVSLDEARAAAAREGKPLFLQINTGNPVGFA